MSWVGDIPFADEGMTQEKLDLLAELSKENNYWKRAYLFVEAITNRKLSSLSNFQRRWLTTIMLDLDQELIRKSWRY